MSVGLGSNSIPVLQRRCAPWRFTALLPSEEIACLCRFVSNIFDASRILLLQVQVALLRLFAQQLACCTERKMLSLLSQQMFSLSCATN